MGEEKDVHKMKVSELRGALAKRGLSAEGVKSDLINRLQARLDEEEFGMEGVVEPSAPELHEGTPEPIIKSAVDPVVPEPTAMKLPVGKPVVELLEDKKEASLDTDTLSFSASTAPSIIRSEEDNQKEDNQKAGTNKSNQEQSLSKVTPGMTFAEKKAMRAARFGSQAENKNESTVRGRKQPATTERGKHIIAKEQTNTPRGDKRQKIDNDESVLSKEEIEKRLARTKKFGQEDPKKVDELKAMLRTHRFAS